MMNGSPMGPGWLIFFNIQDTSNSLYRVTVGEEVRENDDEEVLEILSLVLTARLLE